MVDIAVKDKSRKEECSPCMEDGGVLSPVYDAVEEPRSFPVNVDNDATDTEYSVITEANISYKTMLGTANDISTTNNKQIAVKKSEDVSCKRFICILVTITLVTIISLVCLAILFINISKFTQAISLQWTFSSQNDSVFMSQLQQINKTLINIQDQIMTLSREEMENKAALSNDIQQLNTSIDMQLSTLHNQTQLATE